MTAFSNSVAMPLILVTAVCIAWGDRAPPRATEAAYTMVMIYSLPWPFFMFSLGRQTLRTSMREGPLLHAHADRNTATSHAKCSITRFAPAAAPVAALPRAARVTAFEHDAPTRNSGVARLSLLAARSGMVRAAGWFVFRSPLPMRASIVTVVVVCTPPLQAALFDGGAIDFVGSALRLVGRIHPVVSTLLAAASLHAAFARSGLRASCCSAGRARIATLSCLLRLVLMPAVCYPLTVCAWRIGLLDRSDPVLRLVALLQSAMPSAQLLIAVSEIEIGSRATEELALPYLPHYLCASVTLTIATAAALSVIDADA